MKHIWLIAFLFGLELFACGTLYLHAQTVSLRSDYDFSKEELITSTKLSFPCFEGRVSVQTAPPLHQENIVWNYGLSINTKKLLPVFPITLKIGNLSAAGSLSKLNSPVLSQTVSPFLQTSYLKTFKLQTSLPSYNSFSNLQSYSLEAGWNPNSFVKNLSLVLFYKTNKKTDNTQTTQNNGVLTASFQTKLNPSKKTTIEFCSTGGVYPYKEKKKTKKSNYHYSAGNHICFNNQISFSSKSFSSLLIISTYQSPFGDFANTWRTENLLKLNNLSFDLCGFFNPHNNILTSSEKKLNPLLQFSIGGQYKFWGKIIVPVLFTAGLNTLVDINYTENKHSLKTAAGLRYSAQFFSGKLSANINFSIENQNEILKAEISGGSIEMSNYFYLNKLTPSIIAKCSFSPNTKRTSWTISEKFGLNFEYELPNENLSFTNKNQITFTQKTGLQQNGISFTSTLSAKFQFRFCSLHVHLEFQV